MGEALSPHDCAAGSLLLLAAIDVGWFVGDAALRMISHDYLDLFG